MQSSTVLRNEQLGEVGRSVLRLISNKIYPLNQDKMNRILKSRNKDKLTKVATEPSESPSRTPTCKHLPAAKGKMLDCEERTIGEHFNQFETRELMLSRLQNREYEVMTEKINEFIWARRQEITVAEERRRSGREIQERQARLLRKCHLRKNSSNIEHCLAKLRKKLKDEYRRESEVFETPICRFSDAQAHSRPTSNVNFFQENEGIERVMERYPLRESSRVRGKEEANRQFQNDLLEEIKNCQVNDKYTRMRIGINHRKIVTLK